MAFYRVEPFGDYRADLRAGIVASTIANVMGGSRKRRPLQPSDFMPYLEHQQHDRKAIDRQIREAFKPWRPQAA